ncbi:ATP-binding protein [Streptomyces tendae]|uniref:sensor histidine kinase n=1 Tax=Streptomyces tendae TaxID=1932 RepID=UPI003666A884
MVDPAGAAGSTGDRRPAVAWDLVAAELPDGLAVVDRAGRFVQANPAALRLLGGAGADLPGRPSPFALTEDGDGAPYGLPDDDGVERVTTWAPPAGPRRELAYRVRPLAADPSLSAVAFRDVTAELHRQRRLSAMARVAVTLSAQSSPVANLDALAAEVLKADALTGVEILTVDEAGDLRVEGTAGFERWPDFFERQREVERRGGALRMRDALRTAEPVVVPHRWSAIREDPAWRPLHDYHTRPEWDSFASVPLMIRGRAAGVLNAFFAPGQTVGQRTLEFLTSMAEQAAIAVDYRALLQRERNLVRREERQRLARDLHDSIVQQVFSIGMQAKSLEVHAQRGDWLPAESVHRVAGEIGVLSQAVLEDLQAMVHELRPSVTAWQGGLEEAVRALAGRTADRTGLRFALTIGAGLERIEAEMAEDVYRIVAEAVHNVVKHAGAHRVTIRSAVRDGRLRATVSDDGRGIGAAGSGGSGTGSGHGLKIMHERAARWGGSVVVEPRRRRGTLVRLTVPLGGRAAMSADGRG